MSFSQPHSPSPSPSFTLHLDIDENLKEKLLEQEMTSIELTVTADNEEFDNQLAAFFEKLNNEEFKEDKNHYEIFKKEHEKVPEYILLYFRRNAALINAERILNNLEKLYQHAKKNKDAIAEAERIRIFLEHVYFSYLLNSKYTDFYEELRVITHQYRLRWYDKISRLFLSLFAGAGPPSTIFNVTSSIDMSTISSIVSVSTTAVVTGASTVYFFKSFKRRDEKLNSSIERINLSILDLISQEVDLKFQCFNHYRELAEFKSHEEHTQNGIIALNTTLEQQIENMALDYPVSRNIYEQLSEEESGSLYTDVFQDRHWAPILTFLGGVGALYGIATSALKAYEGEDSNQQTQLIILGMSALISLFFALQHFRLQKNAENRKAHIDKLEAKLYTDVGVRVQKLDLHKETLQIKIRENRIAELDSTVAELKEQNVELVNMMPNLFRGNRAPQFNRKKLVHTASDAYRLTNQTQAIFKNKRRVSG